MLRRSGGQWHLRVRAHMRSVLSRYKLTHIKPIAFHWIYAHLLADARVFGKYLEGHRQSNQNGLTITSMTIPNISKVGTSFMMRQYLAVLVFLSSANRRTAADSIP